jgi:hypothetical protein
LSEPLSVVEMLRGHKAVTGEASLMTAVILLILVLTGVALEARALVVISVLGQQTLVMVEA